MIKAVIFDFDGVIVESAHIKTAAFRQLFSAWPSQLAEQGVAHHLKNTGITRFVKFRYFYEHILKETYTADIEKELSSKFEQIVFEQVVSAPLVKGAEEFLKQHKSQYKFFIASGTPDSELQLIVRQKGLSNYFERIHGAPATKDKIIRSIMADFHYGLNEVVFIGDGESDLKAAQATGVKFIFRVTKENQHVIPLVSDMINDLEALESKLRLL
ncbi:MAG: HAD family hydrolase [Candidatus Omnitrophica bacterium]|nr:HAD family hydrolase [Candidatus Omnitrophota bacterium]